MSFSDEHARAYALRQLRARTLRSSWAFALVGFGFWYKRSHGYAFDGSDLFLGLAAAALTTWVGYGAFVAGPDDELRWRRAVAQLQWGDALGLLPRIERLVPPPHAPLLRAQALAGLGRRREAQQLVEGVDRSQMSTWEYLTLLARVRAAAGDSAGLRAALEAALPQTPRPRDVLFELAELYLVEDGDAARAEALLLRVNDRAMPAPTAARRLALEGMIAFEAGRLREAEPLLDGALRAIDEEIEPSPELAEQRPKVHAYLAMLTARTNRVGEARIHAREASPELLRRRQEALNRRMQDSLRGRPS